jgi:hypothetical protein
MELGPGPGPGPGSVAGRLCRSPQILRLWGERLHVLGAGQQDGVHDTRVCLHIRTMQKSDTVRLPFSPPSYLRRRGRTSQGVVGGTTQSEIT